MTHRNMSTPPARITPDAPPLGFREFVALVAALMALTALGIDSMLPALPAIGEALGAKTAHERPLVVTAFMIGFGVAQLEHGPLADRFGRKPVLGVALAAYVIANCVEAGSAERRVWTKCVSQWRTRWLPYQS